MSELLCASPRWGAKGSPNLPYTSEPTPLGRSQHPGRRSFLTQSDAPSREATCLSNALPPPSSTCDYEDDDDAEKPRKLNIEEIKKVLYKRECCKLGVTPVGQFLRAMPTSRLAIRYYNLGPEGARALAVPLMLDTTINVLDLEGNGIGPEGMAAMAEMLDEQNTITSLNLRRNNLGSRGAVVICRVLVNNKNITSVNLAANNFVDKDGSSFAQMLKENPKLKTLNLSDNYLGELSGNFFGDSLAQNQVLEELDLSWNRLSGRGAAKLLLAVKESTSLKTLNLSFNSICRGPSGNPLAETLTGNTSLRCLDLSGCHLMDIDFIGVSKALTENVTLEKLKIGQNLVQARSTSLLIKAIAMNDSSSITLLDLADSVIEEAVVSDVEMLQERGVRITYGLVHQSETDFQSAPTHKIDSDENDNTGDEVSDSVGENNADNNQNVPK